MRRYLDSNGQKLQILSILIFFLMVIGIVTGSIFYTKTGDARTAVDEHFKDIFRMAAQTENPLGSAKDVFAGWAVSAAIIFISAFFRLGVLTTAAVTVRRGFIMGFTVASAVGAYGARGSLIMCGFAAELVIGTAILVFFSSVSVSYSIAREKISKKFLIFFAVFAISIFCVLSLLHGFFATTFMKSVQTIIN